MIGIGKEERRPFKLCHKCSYCKDNITHLIDPDTYPNDSIASEFPEGSNKWECGNCKEERMFKLKLKRGLVSETEIKDRMSKLEKQATIQGMVDAIKNNERKDFNFLFKNRGIYDKRKVTEK